MTCAADSANVLLRRPWSPPLPCHVMSLALRELPALLRQPCCFAQPVTSLPTSNWGPEQQIEQTPDPGSLNSFELCTLRSWHGLSLGYAPFTLISNFADFLLWEGRGAGHTVYGY